MEVEIQNAITTEVLGPGGKKPPAKTKPTIDDDLPTIGLILAPPFMAKAVIDGKKSMIVKSRSFEIDNKDYLLISQRKALGVVRVGAKKQINDKEFTELEPKHLITAKLRAEWAEAQPSWKEAPLYAWPIKILQKFDEPKDTNVKPGPQVTVRDVEVEKLAKPFRSPGGKDAWVKELLKRVPRHKTYVEPYAGSASLFFAKEPSEKEVLADIDPNIIAVFKFLKSGSDEDFKWIRDRKWAWSEKHFKNVKKAKPTSLRERAYRYKYLNLFSVRGAGGEIANTERDRSYTAKTFLGNLEKYRERLKSTMIVQSDALKVMEAHDGANTFQYVDPPWKVLASNKEWKDFDGKAFAEAAKKLKSAVLISYQGAIELKGFQKKSVTIAQGDIAKDSTQQLYWNYTTKALEKTIAKIKDVKTYDPSKVSDAVLRDDHRLVLAWYANWKKDPKGFKHNLETIETLLRKILKDAVRRGPEVIQFNPQGMKASVRSFFLQVARDVKLPREMLKKVALKPDTDPEDLTDKELKAAHWQLHEMFDKEKRTQTGVKGWSTEDIVNLHALIVDEMFGRKIPHPPPPDNGLDELSADFEQNAAKQPDWHTKPVEKIEKRDYATINRSGVKRGKEIKIEDVLKHFKTFKVRKPYIYLVGGLANHGKTEGDIDILVNDMEDAPEWLKQVIEFRLGRCLPPELAERMEVHWDRERGPFTKFSELFDLTVERVNEKNEIKEMRLAEGDTEEGDVEKQQARAATAEMKAQADKAAKNDKLTLGEFFYMPKPTRAAQPEQLQTLENFMALYKERAEKWLPTRVQKKMDGCLPRWAKVETELGTIPIWKLVRSKAQIRVKSYNWSTGEVELKPITNWFDNGNTKEYISIRVGGRRNAITCTPNHEIYLPSGEKTLAENIRVGDRICVRAAKLDKHREAFIRGMLLGDACLCRDKRRGHLGLPRLSVSHGAKQAEYLEWTAELLEALGGRVSARVSQYGYPGLRWSSRADAALLSAWEDFYPNGKKRVTREALDKLGPESWAAWIMDDGSLAWNVQPRLQLHTEGYSREENEVIKGYFENLGCKVSIYQYRGYFFLGFSVKSTAMILEKARPWFTMSMSYKAGHVRDLSTLGSAWEEVPETRETVVEREVVRAEPYHPPRAFFGRYDIEVADNHNYFVNGILISNSRHQIAVDGDTVTIISEDGDDNTDRFPKTIEDLKALKVKKLVLDAEIERWDGRQHLPREAAAGYINSKDEPDDSEMITNVFDVLYHGEDGDVHKKSTTERLALLKKLGIKQSTMGAPNLKFRLNAAPGIEVDDLEELERAVRRIRKLPGSEGVVNKQSDAPYVLKVATPDTWVKHHAATTIGGIVMGREKTKGGVWVYQYAVLPGKEEAEETVEVKGQKVVPVGDTFATKRDFSEGDGILVEAETVNIVRSPKGLKITAWVPRVIGELDRKPDTVDQVSRRAARNLVLQQKDIDEEGKITYRPTRKSVKVEKQQDPYMEIPDEDKTYKYSASFHWRGRSKHTDLRLELRPGKLLIGWTLNTQIAGVVKEPVTTLREAQRWSSRANMDKISKINFHTGEWARRPKAGTTKLVRTSVLSERKNPEPAPWLNVEGKTKDPEEGKAPPVGGTRQFPGVFDIVDQGTVEFLAQKPWNHEYAFHGGGLNYRMFFRLLKLAPRKTEKNCEACNTVSVGKEIGWADGEAFTDLCNTCTTEFLEKQGVVLPPSEEQPFKDEAAWLAIYPDDQMPYVLGSDAVKKKWMPPDGISALPKEIRKQIPREFQYWALKGTKAREMRDALVEAVKKDEVKIDVEAPYKSVEKASLLDADFTLQEQTWKGPVQVRLGPTRTRYWVRLDVGRKRLLVLDLRRNPLDNKEVTARVDWDRHKDSLKLEGDISPGHYLNPTKATPSFIEILDKGKAEVTALSDDFIKINFKGKKLKGLIGVKRSNDEWLWSPSQAAPKVEKETEKRFEFELDLPIVDVQLKKGKDGKEKRLVTGIVLKPNVVDGQGDIISEEVIEKAAHQFVKDYNKQTQMGLMHKVFGNNGIELVESWIVPISFKLNGRSVKKGSWVMTAHISSDKVWDKVKKGEITGFSIGGVATVAAD